MKTIQKILWCLACAVLAVALTGCNAADMGMGGALRPSGYDPAYDSDVSDGDTADKSEPDASDGDQTQTMPVRRQLTAAAYSDAENYEAWQRLFFPGDTQTEPGIFAPYAHDLRGLRTFDRHEVRVTSNGKPVAGATVRLYGAQGVLYEAVSDSAGRAYVFGANPTAVEAESGAVSVRGPVEEGVTELPLLYGEEKKEEIELMLVVDTTGSMSDELDFLKQELTGVVQRVAAASSANLRLSLLFYRDDGDAYVTRAVPFTDVRDAEGLAWVRDRLSVQWASGGGDYPEAVDRALREAVDADWHEGTSTKLLFHVLDAPYHDTRGCRETFASAVTDAARKGIRILPLAASGLDTLGQYIMRSAALLTGGTYTFLTDDSGIGDSHDLPDVGAYTVEYLGDMMVRLILGYHTGQMGTPVHWTQAQ